MPEGAAVNVITVMKHVFKVSRGMHALLSDLIFDEICVSAETEQVCGDSVPKQSLFIAFGTSGSVLLLFFYGQQHECP